MIGDNQLNHRKSHFWRRKEKRGQSYKEKVSFMIAELQGMGHPRMTISSLHCNFAFQKNERKSILLILFLVMSQMREECFKRVRARSHRIKENPC